MHRSDHIATPERPPEAAVDPAVDAMFDVGYVTRVEGEGSLRLRIRGGEVTEARLSIFEAPRYFERLVVGRSPDEVLDVVSRICGICPIAYQMTAVRAFEHAFGVEVDPQVAALRRLFYAAEWIQSHALHVYLLHAPDFLGYPSAVAMAADHRPLVERGLRLKRLGNDIMALLGGRAIHPVSIRVGGFSRVPRRDELVDIRRRLDEGVADAIATVELAAGLLAPTFDRERPLVALRDPDAYPYADGRIVSTDGLDLAGDRWDDAFAEEQHEGTNALHARTTDGRVYLLGPSARVTLDADRLQPLAADALARLGLADRIRTNPYWSIAARAIELVQATVDARDVIDAYVPPAEPRVTWSARPGRAAWATEAPRGLIFHRYEVDERGLIAAAQIVPPTSQNQGAIEEDLRDFAPSVLGLPRDEATVRLEQLIRSYDPCISCATHFLELDVEEDPR
jgi:coenzyme F420-reducing hydrogenase alpha subunit